MAFLRLTPVSRITGSRLAPVSLIAGGVMAGILGIGVLVPGAGAGNARPTAPPQALAPRALLDQYCVACHNQTAMTAGLALDVPDPSDVGAHPEIWERVVRKLRAGMMPPAGAPRPDPAAYKTLTVWLEGALDAAAVTHLPPPGLHRMNRTEYANAVRDLLDLKIDPSVFLPSDDSSHGFDNMAGSKGARTSRPLPEAPGFRVPTWPRPSIR